MTTHGGYTLLLGNNSSFYTNVVDRGWGSEWTAESFDAWQRELQANLDRELGRDASEIARDQWQSRVARQFIAANPQRFLSAVWQRVRSLWSTMPQREAASGMNPLILAAVGWYYSLVLTAFVVGLTVAGWQGLWLNIPLTSSVDEASKLRSQTRSDQSCRAVAWTLISLVLTVQAVHLVYWTNARMRAPIAPVIGLLAGVTTGKFGRSSPGLIAACWLSIPFAGSGWNCRNFRNWFGVPPEFGRRCLFRTVPQIRSLGYFPTIQPDANEPDRLRCRADRDR